MGHDGHVICGRSGSMELSGSGEEVREVQSCYW